MRKITRHIVHCSDSGFGDVPTIRTWHKQRGFNDVGYHYVIRRDGEIEVGRTMDVVGAHAKGYNSSSIGTCLIGKDEFTEEQFTALRRIDTMLKSLFGDIETVGHTDVNPAKPCPNFDVKRVLEND